MTMSSPKAQRMSPARNPSTPTTEKARKAASAEIQKRLDAMEAPQTGDVAPTGQPATEGGVTAKAGSPRPPAQTSGGKGGKGKKGAKAAKAEKPAKGKAGAELVVAVDRRTPKGAVRELERDAARMNAEAAKKGGKAPKPEKPKRLSCLDAAAQVLSASKEPLKAKEMIEAMGKQGLWSSPNGKTPEASLYAAIIREIAAKGVDARFVKTERGTFAAPPHGKGR